MKMKRVLSLLLALVMTFSLLTLPTYAADDDNFASLTVEEQYDALMAMEESDAEAAFYALTEEQQNALMEYAAEVNGLDTTPVQELNVISSSVVAPLVKADAEPAMPAKKAPMKAALKAAPAPDSTSNKETENGHEGLFLNKNVTKNADGTYTLRLESYVTGNVTISTETTTLPSDIVLVLDVSGSMDETIKVGSKNDTSELDTKYGAAKGVYRLASLGNYDMRYYNGKWQFYRPDGINIFSWKWYDLDDTWFGNDIEITKMNALKIATKNFVDQVQAKAIEDGVDHKISIVTYSGSSTVVQNLTSVTSTSNANATKNNIDRLSANGATRADLGMGNAKNIINGISRDSNKVVIMFTDGVPTSGNTFENSVANATIANSKDIKAKGATVYTIGVLDGADDRVPMPSDASDVNKYMHYVSSNFKNASSMTSGGTPTYPGGNQSYYLAASNADQISGIFKQISEQIETGGASRNLGTSTVVKDVVTKGFDLPDNVSDIKVYTAPYQGYEADGTTRKFGTPVEYKSADVKIDGQTVTVKNFDYSSDANCVTDTTKNGTTTYSGNKLIVEFKITRDKDFLGGNQVPTNENTSGVYENDTATTPVGTFVVPKTNVDIPEVTVTAVDKNVYLMHTMTDAECMAGATAMCNGMNLLNSAEYTGENAWKAEYVTVTTEVTKPSKALTDDSTYTVTATVSPKHSGTATAQTGSATANVNVFKPEVTFCDSEVYYGDTAPVNPTAYDTNNLVSTVWKHGDDVAPPSMGAAPTLNLTYTPGTGIANGIINTTSDIPVVVTVVKIGNEDVTGHTKFQHTKCTADEEIPANAEFVLHVKTCTLTVKKDGWDSKDANQSFIFNVTGGAIQQSMKVTVQGNGSTKIVGLPIGSYTVTEDGNWSWRYTAKGSGSADLSAASSNGTVTITNERNNPYWLSGDNYAVNHVGGIKPRGTFVSGN